MVSGGVMLAITFLTFDVMLTNAKISTAGVKAAAAESVQRSGIELLQQDILTANAALINASDAGKYESKDDKTLILRQPTYNPSGNIVAGKNKIVVYMTFEVSGKNSLYRFEGTQSGSSPFTLAKTDLIAEDVLSFNYRLAKSMSIVPSITGVTLPGIPVASEPASGKIRILKVKSTVPPINIDKDQEDKSSRGLTTTDLTTSFGQVVTTYLSPMTSKPMPAIDILYEVDEGTTTNSDKSIDANQIRVWIKVKGRNEQPDTTLSATGMMRNAS